MWEEWTAAMLVWTQIMDLFAANWTKPVLFCILWLSCEIKSTFILRCCELIGRVNILSLVLPGKATICVAASDTRCYLMSTNCGHPLTAFLLSVSLSEHCNNSEMETHQGHRGGSVVKRPALGFSSGHDLTVREFEPLIGLCADSVEPAWDSFSPSPVSAPSQISLCLKNKQTNLKWDLKKLFYIY